jgi:hypothetical protein
VAFGVAGTTINAINDLDDFVGFYSAGTKVNGFAQLVHGPLTGSEATAAASKKAARPRVWSAGLLEGRWLGNDNFGQIPRCLTSITSFKDAKRKADHIP